jgi:hypothetical protein
MIPEISTNLEIWNPGKIRKKFMALSLSLSLSLSIIIHPT